MPRSARRRSRKHGREERDRPADSDEDPRPREQEDRKGSVRGSKEHEKRLSSALAKRSNAGEESGSSAEGQKKRKSRGEQETAATRDGKWSGGGDGEDERLHYHDSKKSRNSDGDVKGKSARKSKESDRSEEAGRRKSDNKGTLVEEHSAGHHHRVKERGVDLEEAKSKASKQVMMLKEDNMDQQYKKDRSRDHEMGNGGRHDASLKAMTRNKEVKTRDSDGDKARNKSNGTDDRQREDELHDGELEKNGRHSKTKDQSVGRDESQGDIRERQTMPRDVRTKIDGYYEQQHTDEKLKDDMPRGVEKRGEEKYKDDRSKVQDRHKSNKYKDRYKEEERHRDERYKEERHRDERYKEERSRHEDRHRDVKYKDERYKEEGGHKDERCKEKPRDEEKPRKERSDNSSREKHRDDTCRSIRNQDGGSWDVRSSKDNTRDRSLEKHYKEELNYSESRYSKDRLHDSEQDASAADRRSTKYRDDSKGKKRSHEESVRNGNLEPRNAKEYHGDATKKHRSEVGSFLSSEDHRREYEKVDSRKRDIERKSPSRSSTYHVKEQSRHLPKQEETSPREYGAALGRQRRTSDFQSVEDLSKTDAKRTDSSLPSKDGRTSRSDGRPIHFNDRQPSMSDRQVPIRNNVRHSLDSVDGSMKNGNTRHHELLFNCRVTENYQSASPGHLHPAPSRSEMDTQRSFNDDTRSQVRERRSSSRSRRSGTIDTTRGLGNNWNNPSSWPSPVPNGFGPFQHGPPVPGFHPAIHQFPQSWMRPPMDMNHAGVHYPLHGHPESFSQFAQPFPWHNPAEEPYLSRLPGWDANRSVFEENSDSYGRQDLGGNKGPDSQQQSEPEMPLASHISDKPSLIRFPAQNQSENVKTGDESNAEKADTYGPKYRSERTPGPSNVEVDSRFCSNYFKNLDISTSLASPELYKKCVTMAGELEMAESCKFSMHRCLKNNKNERGYQAEGSKYMIKSMFSGKTTSVFEKAMLLYSSSTGSRKSKSLASSSQPESKEMTKEASVDMVEEGNVTVAEDQALPCTDMCDEEHNNDHQPHRRVDSSMPGEAGVAKDCSNAGEDKVGSDPHDAKALQPCCDSVGSIPDIPKEQVSGVSSDATFASGSQSCEDVMPGCSRVNLNRIPCSPGST